MLRNQDKLDDCFSKVALTGKDLNTKVTRSLENNFINKETHDLFTAIFESLGAQLEALQLLANEIEAPIDT